MVIQFRPQIVQSQTTVQCSPDHVHLKRAVSAVKGGLDLFQFPVFYFFFFSPLPYFLIFPSTFSVSCNYLFLPALLREDTSALGADFCLSLRGDSKEQWPNENVSERLKTGYSKEDETGECSPPRVLCRQRAWQSCSRMYIVYIQLVFLMTH
ncbi:uncharacterized protein LJ206_006819 [Theristicus caerulescens]